MDPASSPQHRALDTAIMEPRPDTPTAEAFAALQRQHQHAAGVISGQDFLSKFRETAAQNASIYSSGCWQTSDKTFGRKILTATERDNQQEMNEFSNGPESLSQLECLQEFYDGLSSTLRVVTDYTKQCKRGETIEHQNLIKVRLFIALFLPELGSNITERAFPSLFCARHYM